MEAAHETQRSGSGQIWRDGTPKAAALPADAGDPGWGTVLEIARREGRVTRARVVEVLGVSESASGRGLAEDGRASPAWALWRGTSGVVRVQTPGGETDVLEERLRESHRKRGSQPTPEILAYARAVDLFAVGRSDADSVQRSLCEYLDAVALRGRAVSDAVGRTREPPLADVLTEGVALLVDGVVRAPELASHRLTVASEKGVPIPGHKTLKPDVSVWLGEKLLSVVECKTNLGYSRNGWLGPYEQRTAAFARVGVPEEAVLLVVATETNWEGFPSAWSDPRAGRQWITLAKRGTWFGGGKSKGSEHPLARMRSPGAVEAIVNSLRRAALRAAR